MPIADNVQLADGVSIAHPELVNLYGCRIGAGTKIGPFVEIQRNVTIGPRCKVGSHSFICEGVEIGSDCFIGHHVCFINDRHPRSVTPDGRMQTDEDWKVIPTRVDSRASIGSAAVILCGVTIGAGALVGAGAVVTHDVAPGEVVTGVPARLLYRFDSEGLPPK